MDILEVQGLFKDFSGLEVLLGIDLKVRQGECHAIIGPNGAGKSTLFNVITGMYKPSRGRVLFQGKDISGLPAYKIVRLGLARSFQINNLFGAMTVHQNVRNAALSRGSHRLNLLRRITGMNDIEEKTSMVLRTVGLEFSSGMQADELPYGHQRALEIAIALATDPHVVLLDEPTAGMDKEETRATVALIKEVTKGKTVVVVDHDMEVVFSIADRISVVYYGRVLATGTPDEIRNNREVNEAYLGSRNPC